MAADAHVLVSFLSYDFGAFVGYFGVCGRQLCVLVELMWTYSMGPVAVVAMFKGARVLMFWYAWKPAMRVRGVKS